MARNSQKNFLQNVLADEGGIESETPSPVQQARGAEPGEKRTIGSSVMGPNNVIQRLASGQTKQVIQSRVDPARCRIWPGNARRYELLTYEACHELIDSIIVEGGQKLPAIVRRLKDDPDHDYEVIVGSRRHWSVTWLQANNYPDMMFLVQPEIITDEAAFRLADLENRVRDDISAYERALNFEFALHAYYGGHASKMAERLNLSKGMLSKMLSFSKLPKEIPGAFALLSDIAIRQWYPLMDALEDQEIKGRAIAAAKAIAKEQENLKRDGLPLLDGAKVTAKIVAAMKGPNAPKADLPEALFDGKKLVSVISSGRTGVKLQIHKFPGVTRSDVLKGLEEALSKIFD
jgi:ParB family transcriptional regulator, chromosome partitioning protein